MSLMGTKNCYQKLCKTWHKIETFYRNIIDDSIVDNGHMHLNNCYVMYVKFIYIYMYGDGCF
jgi:hypothetical protein